MDDGSTDGSLDVISKCCAGSGHRIKVISHRNNENWGLARTYAAGLDGSEGKYIAFLEADDIWCNNHLSELTQVLERGPEVVLVYGDVQLFGGSSLLRIRKHFHHVVIKRMVPRNCVFNARQHLSSNNIIPGFSSALVRSRVMRKLNFCVPRDYPAWLDWWLWLQMAEYGAFYFLDKVLSLKRTHCKSYNNLFCSNLIHSYRLKRDFRRQYTVNSN